MTSHGKSGECCPRFDPKPWDGKKHVWKGKPFIRDTVPQFLHMPLPWMVGKVVTRMWEKACSSKADVPMKDFILMAYDSSPWKSEFYMAVRRKVEDAENVSITGTFFSKVFDGPFRDIPKYMKEMEAYVSGKGKTIKKHYFYYTTCPKCARKHGHNYIVAFAQVA